MRNPFFYDPHPTERPDKTEPEATPKLLSNPTLGYRHLVGRDPRSIQEEAHWSPKEEAKLEPEPEAMVVAVGEMGAGREERQEEAEDAGRMGAGACAVATKERVQGEVESLVVAEVVVMRACRSQELLAAQGRSLAGPRHQLSLFPRSDLYPERQSMHCTYWIFADPIVVATEPDPAHRRSELLDRLRSILVEVDLCEGPDVVPG